MISNFNLDDQKLLNECQSENIGIINCPMVVPVPYVPILYNISNLSFSPILLSMPLSSNISTQKSFGTDLSQNNEENLASNGITCNKSSPFYMINNLACYNYNISNEIIAKNTGQFKKMHKVRFSREEDEQIKNLVQTFGSKNWSLIASFMNRRNAKQCRDRYFNYLIPGFFKGEWTKEEDELLVKLYNEFGPKWSLMQKRISNRSTNSIKNRWYYFLVKKYRNETINQENQRENKQIDDFGNNKDNENNNQSFNSIPNFSSIDTNNSLLFGKKNEKHIEKEKQRDNVFLNFNYSVDMPFNDEWSTLNY